MKIALPFAALAATALLAAAEGVRADDGDGASVRPFRPRAEVQEGKPGRSIRVFKLQHKSPAEAVAVVQPLLSIDGSLTLSPAAKVISVLDDEEHIRIVSEALRQFDVAPRTYRVKVAFLRATGGGEEPPKTASGPTLVRGLGRRISDVLRYSQYERIDEVTITGEEGSTLSARMGGEFAVEFLLEGDSKGTGEIRLRNFRVSRIRKDERGVEQLSHVLGTSINLRLERPFVLGATRDEKSRSALLVHLEASAVPPTP